MCFGSSKREDAHTAKSREIERQLRTDQRQQAHEVKLLLLGAGESGKSTVLKQMRLIHTSGFSTQERKQWKVTIFSNLLHAFQLIFVAMEEQEIDFASLENNQYVPLIANEPEIGPEEPMPSEYLGILQNLWIDEGVQMAISKGNEYALHDNLTYFFGRLKDLFARDYLPSNQDILRAKLRTLGITETVFDTGTLTYRMFDVGGQRSERKKWLHVFDNVQAVLFLVAMNGYDQGLLEDRNGNQMHEALMLFESIANTKYFQNSALIIFLNKIDLFRAKVLSGNAPIRQQFPEFRGPEEDVEAGQDFFAQKFRNLIRDPNKDPYIHYTDATDTNLLDRTMKNVQDMIVQRNLHRLML